MRHVNPGMNPDALKITSEDPDEHGRVHLFTILGPNGLAPLGDIEFQRGPVKENGVNGVTAESLIAVTADYLGSLNKPPFNTRETACAITHLEEALMWLDKRTHDRQHRGVEGTNQA